MFITVFFTMPMMREKICCLHINKYINNQNPFDLERWSWFFCTVVKPPPTYELWYFLQMLRNTVNLTFWLRNLMHSSFCRSASLPSYEVFTVNTLHNYVTCTFDLLILNCGHELFVTYSKPLSTSAIPYHIMTFFHVRYTTQWHLTFWPENQTWFSDTQTYDQKTYVLPEAKIYLTNLGECAV